MSRNMVISKEHLAQSFQPSFYQMRQNYDAIHSDNGANIWWVIVT